MEREKKNATRTVERRTSTKTKKETPFFSPFFFSELPPGLLHTSLPRACHFHRVEMAVSPLPTASSKTAAIARSPSAAAAAASRPRASPIARSAVNAPPPTAPAPSSSSSSRREPPSLQGSDADKLREGIATFYDESSQLWEDIWCGALRRREKKNREGGGAIAQLIFFSLDLDFS